MSTAQVIPSETGLCWVEGAPEGRDYAPAGYLEIDRFSGILYRKTTPQEYCIGWVNVGADASFFGGLQIGSLMPNGNVTGSPGGAYVRVDAVFVELWVKLTGIQNKFGWFQLVQGFANPT